VLRETTEATHGDIGGIMDLVSMLVNRILVKERQGIAVQTEAAARGDEGVQVVDTGPAKLKPRKK